MDDVVLKLEHIRKVFPSPAGDDLEILKDVNLEVRRGEAISIVGQSGSGKSTLLSIAALLLSHDGGSVLYNDKDITNLNEREISRIRSRSMGFVFQSSLLLEDFTALENVAMPLMIQRADKKSAFRKAMEYLELMGLETRSSHRPKELSGGERQRVAIARALVTSPSIIFADEPTGALDEASASNVESLLLEAIKDKKLSMLLVTHNLSFAKRCDRCLALKSGVLLSDE